MGNKERQRGKRERQWAIKRDRGGREETDRDG